MDTKGPDRVVQLWPDLPEQARRAIVEIAEGTAGRSLELTAEEEELLKQAQDDFRTGRVLSMDEFSSEMKAFMTTLKSRKS